jgi:acetoacetyl-CoA synthetase
MAPPDPVLGPRWFDGARLNFAENLLRHRDDGLALVAWSERGAGRRLTYAQLAAEVARVAGALRAAGVEAGDRVAGFMPNVPEAVVAMLAAASLGAIWSSCSPDFGVRGVLDRFGQIAPTVLVAADGYVYAGKAIDVLPRVREIAAALPSVRRVVLVPHLRPAVEAGAVPGGVAWADFGTDAPLDFARLPFDHPLYVMYSSGTTGLPKCMVHSAGGTLLQHLKELVLHTDLRREDRIFYFTTCGWMMWNWLVSSLAVGATVVLYDGAPLAPHAAALWDMAQAEGVTIFGTSAKYLALLEKEGVHPAESHDLPALRAILSTRGARWRSTRTTSCTSGSSATCGCRASAAGRTSSPASRSATRSGRCTAASCRRAASGWRWTCSTRRGGRCAAPRGSWCARAPSRACPSRSGTTPTARRTAARTSSASPACGATATGRSSRRAAAW